MGVVWVVDQPEAMLPDYLLGLMGNFPCRVVGSVQTVGKLLKLNSFARPNLVVVNTTKLGVSPRYARDVIACDLPGTPIVLLYSGLDSSGDELNWDVEMPVFEMIARSRSLLKAVPQSKDRIFFGPLVLDIENNMIEDSETGLSEYLTPKETRILKLLFGKEGQTIDRETIKQCAWAGSAVSDRTIDSHISRLRKRLGTLNVTIQNIYGGGYLLK